VVRLAWVAVLIAAFGVRLWNALTGPLMWGYDAAGHIAYVFYLDRYAAIPWAHQGWGYFHPPFHYLFGLALAQFGSAEVLLRGLALVGSVASLAIAGFAAKLTQMAVSNRPLLPLVAFVAVAFLPVHLYTSPMVGNELTCAFFGAAALFSTITNEGRPRPEGIGDTRTGLLVGLALLSKFSGVTYFAGCRAVIALRPVFAGGGPAAWRAAIRRASVLGAVVLVIAGPYYARNFTRYDTPFRMNRDYALTADIEAQQAPGSRSWRDFVALSPQLLADPRPGAPHLVHSVWGTAYVNAWVDTRALWNRLSGPEAERLVRVRVTLVWLGLGPTALAVVGAFAAMGDVRRRRRLAVELPLLVFGVFALLAFASFSFRVPRISALKASYLMGLSLPFGVFVARGLEAVGRTRVRAAIACTAVALPAFVAAAVYWNGWVHPRRDHHRTLGAVHLLAGDTESARAFYRGKLALTPGGRLWTEGLAAVELVAGDAARARDLYREIAASVGVDAERLGQRAVAEALAGDLAAARLRLDRALAAGAGADALANRGAVFAALGEAVKAEADLAAALTSDPGFAVAAHNLAVVRARAGRPEAAVAARRAWSEAVDTPPDGYPYGVGVGLLEPGARPLLWLGPDGLRLAAPPFRGGG
jgi:Tfp pilus assembly protein PilF